MSWEKLERAVASVDEQLLSALAPGASDNEIGDLEAALGRELPAEFTKAWGQHNGQAKDQLGGGNYCSKGLLTMIEFLDTREIQSEWSSSQEFCDDDSPAEAEGPVKPDWWNSAWIPVALIGGETRYFCMDLDPAPGGRMGQIIHATPKWEERRVVASGINEFLALIASAIVSGKFELDGGEIDVCEELQI